MILAHYMIDDIKDKEKFIAHAASVLDDKGYFSLNAFGNVPMTHFDFWYDVFKKVGVKTNVIDAVLKEEQKVHDECVSILSKYFEKRLANEDVKIPHDGGFWRLSH